MEYGGWNTEEQVKSKAHSGRTFMDVYRVESMCEGVWVCGGGVRRL